MSYTEVTISRKFDLDKIDSDDEKITKFMKENGFKNPDSGSGFGDRDLFFMPKKKINVNEKELKSKIKKKFSKMKLRISFSDVFE